MRAITVADAENSRALLQQEINRHQDARYDHRLHCVSLVATGMPCEQVAHVFGDSPRSVAGWVRRFDRQGLAGLAEGNHSGRPGRLTAEQMEEVRDWLRQPPTQAGLNVNLWDGKTLARCLVEHYQIHLGVRQCQRLFQQLDLRYRLPRPAVGKADPSRQAEHKKLHAWAQDPTIDLWALDEVHFCQHGSRCRMWVPWETTDPVLWHYPGRKSVGYFGAVRLRDGRGLFQKETGMFEGETFWPFLQRLRSVSAESGRTVKVITDNAKYHHAKLHAAWRQEQAPAFALDYLPPYSPELNPIERVWKRTRRNCVHNVYFPTLQSLVEKVEIQFLDWSVPNEELASLCRI